MAAKSSDKAELFALTTEACRRALTLEPFREQLFTGLSTADGKLIEMGTGEGKILAAVFTTVYWAFQHGRIHIFTANEYLARRDAEWMESVYELLGLSVGFIQENMQTETKRKAYECNITYLTARQAGFDYLKNQIIYHPDEKVQKPFTTALVDEAYFIMIDEGRILEKPHNGNGTPAGRDIVEMDFQQRSSPGIYSGLYK